MRRRAAIGDGEQVAIFNDRARLEVARSRQRPRAPGVVCVPSGYWASLSPGGLSVNALTSDALTDRGGGSALGSTLVQVEPLADPAPAGSIEMRIEPAHRSVNPSRCVARRGSRAAAAARGALQSAQAVRSAAISSNTAT